MATHPDDTQDLSDIGPPEPAKPAGSIWSQLRAEHAQLANEREPLILPVPGLPHMAVRYRWYPMSAEEKSAQRILKLRERTTQAVESAIATLLLACDELLVMNPDDPRANDGGWAPLTEPGFPPVKFDRVLCEGMEWPNPELMNARRIVRKLFGDEKGERALIRHAFEVSEWLAEEGEQIDEGFSGK
jgi:hypothetical protein